MKALVRMVWGQNRFKCFWKQLGPFVVRALNKTFEDGEHPSYISKPFFQSRCSVHEHWQAKYLYPSLKRKQEWNFRSCLALRHELWIKKKNHKHYCYSSCIKAVRCKKAIISPLSFNVRFQFSIEMCILQTIYRAGLLLQIMWKVSSLSDVSKCSLYVLQ